MSNLASGSHGRHVGIRRLSQIADDLLEERVIVHLRDPSLSEEVRRSHVLPLSLSTQRTSPISYTCTFPVLEPTAHFRPVESQLTLFNAAPSSTCVVTTGTFV